MSSKFAFVLGALAVLFVGASGAYERNLAVTIPPLHDLEADSKLAQGRQIPLLLMFASESCPYCVQVEEEFIKPMIISGHYTDKVLIRHVMVDGSEQVRGFDGRAISVDDLARRYSVSMVPTVVIVDPSGEPLVPRLVGITTRDFYGGELDDAIDASLAKLRTRVSASLGAP
jgi:thioredoxin-related protein